MARKTFPLRLDPRLYEELRRWADAEFRSVNAQIEFILRRAVEARRRGVGEGGAAAGRAVSEGGPGSAAPGGSEADADEEPGV